MSNHWHSTTTRSPTTYLDHANIIRTIPNRKRHSAKTVLHKLHDKCFLEGRHPTAYDTLAQRRQAQQQVLVPLIRQCLPTEISTIRLSDKEKKNIHVSAQRHPQPTQIHQACPHCPAPQPCLGTIQ
jgi:hypothetical protein